MKIYFLVGLLAFSWSALLNDIPINLEQPDSTLIPAFASGDEYYVRLHDKDNYTIVQNTYDGYYYYAELYNNIITPTHFRADQPIPDSIEISQGITITKSD